MKLHDVPPDPPTSVPPDAPAQLPPQPVTPDGDPVTPVSDPMPPAQPEPVREPPLIRPPVSTLLEP